MPSTDRRRKAGHDQDTHTRHGHQTAKGDPCERDRAWRESPSGTVSGSITEMSRTQTELGTVALFDASEDTIAMMQALLTEAGASQSLIGCSFGDLKRGITDFRKYLAQHNPEVVIVDLLPPYHENWAFFTTMRDAAVMQGRGVVLTTTNKNQLDDLLGKDSHAFEVVGVRADHALILAAIKAATHLARIARLAVAAEDQGTQNEPDRSNGVDVAEEKREVAEEQREVAEEQREVAEEKREVAECDRETDEGLRLIAEGVRRDAEASRLAAEETRLAAEQLRRNAEHVRQAAEGAREAAATALGARNDVVTAAAALREGLADQQRQLEELQAKTADLRRNVVPPDLK
jgi:hypothetical protein